MRRKGPPAPARSRTGLRLALLGVLIAGLLLVAFAGTGRDDPPASAAAASTGATVSAPLHAPPPPPPRADAEAYLQARLRFTPQRLLPPDGTLPECASAALPWHVSPAIRDELQVAVADLSLADPLGSAVREAVRCEPGATCDNAVPPEVLVALPPRARARLYPLLGRERANLSYPVPFRFHGTDPAAVRPALPEIPDATFERMRPYLYAAGSDVLFADLPAVCSGLVDAERRTLLRSLHATPAVSVALALTPDLDPSEVAAWFHDPAAASTVRAVLEAGGGEIEIADLLPRFARDRVNRFPVDPEPSDPRNCFWTALNFGRAEPDPRLSRTREAQRELETRYRPVGLDEVRYGDVVAWQRADGLLIHAAVKIIGDVYFTRNGFIPARPWVLMRMADMEMRYRDATPRAYRPLDLP